MALSNKPKEAALRDLETTKYLRQILNRTSNSLVCGGTRERRRQVVRLATADVPKENQFVHKVANEGIADDLEALGRPKGEFLVVFHDAHLIPASRMWQIRSVAQRQRNVVYIFEGAHRGHMLDMVTDYGAAFYQQLTVVDLNPRKRPAWLVALRRAVNSTPGAE